MGEFHVKVFRVGEQVLVAACDGDLLGKTIRSEKGVELHVSEQFYGGKSLTAKETCEAMMAATSLNLIGDAIVQLALSSGYGHPDSVVKIGGVSHLIIIHV